MKTIVLPVGNVDVQLIAEGDAIARMTLNGKAWEPETRQAWGVLVTRGNGLVLDVGAYSGVYSIASALMGQRVIAFEPHPANYARLLRNAALNSMRFQTLDMAATDKNETTFLFTKKPAEVMSDTASLGMPGEDFHKIKVGTKRIDDLSIPHRVGLIKLDVEHHELDALMGARSTIEKHKPIVVVETLNPTACNTVAVHLKVYGYKCIAMLDSRNVVYE